MLMMLSYEWNFHITKQELMQMFGIITRSIESKCSFYVQKSMLGFFFFFFQGRRRLHHDRCPPWDHLRAGPQTHLRRLGRDHWRDRRGRIRDHGLWRVLPDDDELNTVVVLLRFLGGKNTTHIPPTRRYKEKKKIRRAFFQNLLGEEKKNMWFFERLKTDRNRTKNWTLEKNDRRWKNGRITHTHTHTHKRWRIERAQEESEEEELVSPAQFRPPSPTGSKRAEKTDGNEKMCGQKNLWIFLPLRALFLRWNWEMTFALRLIFATFKIDWFSLSLWDLLLL